MSTITTDNLVNQDNTIVDKNNDNALVKNNNEEEFKELKFKTKNSYYLLTYGSAVEILNYNWFINYTYSLQDFSEYHFKRLKNDMATAHICWAMQRIYDANNKSFIYTCIKHKESCIIFSENIFKCASIIYDLHYHKYENFIIHQLRTNQQYYVKIKTINSTLEQEFSNINIEETGSIDSILKFKKQIVIELNLIDNNVQLFSTHRLFDKHKYKKMFKMNYTTKIKAKKLKRKSFKLFEFTKEEYEKQTMQIKNNIGLNNYETIHELQHIYTTGNFEMYNKSYYEKKFVKLMFIKQDYQAVNFLNFYTLLKNQLLQNSTVFKSSCFVPENKLLKSYAGINYSTNAECNSNKIKIWLAKPYYENNINKKTNKMNLSIDSFFENLLLDRCNIINNNNFFLKTNNNFLLNESLNNNLKKNNDDDNNFMIYVPCSNIFTPSDYNYNLDFYENIILAHNQFKSNIVNEIEKIPFINKEMLTLITLIWIPLSIKNSQINNNGVLCLKYFDNEYTEKTYYYKMKNENIKKNVEKYREIFKNNRNDLQHLFSTINLFDCYDISIFYNIDNVSTVEEEIKNYNIF